MIRGATIVKNIVSTVKLAPSRNDHGARTADRVDLSKFEATTHFNWQRTVRELTNGSAVGTFGCPPERE